MNLSLLERFLQALAQLPESEQNEALLEGSKLLSEYNQQQETLPGFSAPSQDVRVGDQPLLNLPLTTEWLTQAQEQPERTKSCQEPGEDTEATKGLPMHLHRFRMHSQENSTQDAVPSLGSARSGAGDKKHLHDSIDSFLLKEETKTMDDS